MTFWLGSTKDDNSSRFTCGTYTLPPLRLGEEVVGDTGATHEPVTDSENSEKPTLLRADFALIPSFTNLTTLEPTGCGAEEKQLQEEMKKDMLAFLTKLSENLFENYAKESRG